MPNISPASIAVLPFAYRGDDQKEAYLAEAITEELAVGLTKFEGLAIIARQSTLHFKDAQTTIDEVARELDVRFVLAGSVRKHSEVIRVAARLTDARAKTLLWAESVDRDLSTAGLFATLDDITRRIIDEIKRYAPNVPGWLRAVAFLYQLEKGEYDRAARSPPFQNYTATGVSV